ncbi:uncharacterized protein LOC134848546 isoform X2 [Symsagittifera roscoffensis]|uniref:uncharacterized protein LOC134848546 isoform X2 n=1 Tax=Symsagittifera roscoffensis TaxID=84072 RepID=UPI00307C8A5F
MQELAEDSEGPEVDEEGFSRLYEILNPFPMQTQLYEKYARSWSKETLQNESTQGEADRETFPNPKSKTWHSISPVARLFPKLSEYSLHLWNTSYMAETELEKFLLEDGKVPCPDAESTIYRYRETWNKPNTLSFAGFVHFLFSEKCTAVKRVESRVNMDMRLPLNHYYINSSHNTYLEGNQLTSDCTSDAYIRVLKMGVRFLELDVHPGSSNSEPVIKHLNFPTSPLPLREACEAIKKYAFVRSQYPVILSIEDHVEKNDDAKITMNKIFIEVFKENLLTDEKLRNNQLLPSPEELKGFIIIKVCLAIVLSPSTKYFSLSPE